MFSINLLRVVNTLNEKSGRFVEVDISSKFKQVNIKKTADTNKVIQSIFYFIHKKTEESIL